MRGTDAEGGGGPVAEIVGDARVGRIVDAAVAGGGRWGWVPHVGERRKEGPGWAALLGFGPFFFVLCLFLFIPTISILGMFSSFENSNSQYLDKFKNGYLFK